jgi:hypothetical protein
MSNNVPMMNQVEPEATVDLERLLFRRQFLLGPKCFTPNKHWSRIQLLRGLNLSVHNDLPCASTSQGEISVTLIGCLIDPHHPQYTEHEILQSLLSNALELNSLIDFTRPLVGRWVIIFQNHQGTYLFTDPCGFRQVFYHSDGKHVWCASQPELIKANQQLRLNTDDALMRFLMHPVHIREESGWVGPTTLYKNCFHLLPNHYLSVDHIEQIRFYPREPLRSKNTPEIVESACAILQGTMTALEARHNVALALTAGWDSRVLLAASKHVSESIEYFVYSGILRGSNSIATGNHPDIWVPDKIAKKIGIRFVVKRPADQLPGWFVSMLSNNVTCARVLPKTHIIYDELVADENRININGNGSEICRNGFDEYCNLDIESLSSGDLAALMFFKSGDMPLFAIKEIDNWRGGLDSKAVESFNILDLLYWEQRIGNWGAQYPAEQDIAVEEISPFNCRLLIETLLSSPRYLRAAPDFLLYQDLIRYMWPEILAFPINPQPKRIVLKQKVRSCIPSSVIRLLKGLPGSKLESC